MVLDKIDRKILYLLQKDGKIKNSRISKIIKISAPATLERIKKLEMVGAIKHYTVVLNHERIGFQIMVILNIRLNPASLVSIAVIKRQIAALDEVIECYQTDCANEFILKVISKDIKSYARFINNKLILINGIQATNSLFVIDHLKTDGFMCV